MTDLDNAPVTRRELGELRQAFFTELANLERKIEELFKAKQFDWRIVMGALALIGGAVGFGVKNLTDIAAVKALANSHSSAIEDFRSRIRGNEVKVSAIQIENETQNRWMADVQNMEADFMLMLMRMEHPEIPARSYMPLGRIGEAYTPNGH
ncbi:MAG TPA: hypothetical protein VF653_01300 [Methylomirabilota bacterium]